MSKGFEPSDLFTMWRLFKVPLLLGVIYLLAASVVALPIQGWLHFVSPHVPLPLQVVLLVGLAGSVAFLVVAYRRSKPKGSGAHGTARWGSGRELQRETGVLLGRRLAGQWGEARRRDAQGKLLRYDGEGHLLTVAPTRSGKGTGAIIPNLLTYPGSVVVTDPKGENYAVTASRRRALGSKTLALDPFGLVGGHAAFNPLDLVDAGGPDALDDAAMLADMLVVPDGRRDSTSDFWQGEAKALLTGLVLHVAATETGPDRSLVRVRELLSLPPKELTRLLEDDMLRSDACGGLVQRAAARILQKAEKERSGVISTAQTHTHFLDSPRMARVLTRSSFDLAELKHPAGDHESLSLSLVLPPERIDTYRGWLRLVVACALLTMSRVPGVPRRRVLFLLDEFANLGRLAPVERAVSLAAGYGAQLWLFLQDLTQLRAVYPETWGSFLANAAVLQAFGTADEHTAEYLSQMTGQATVRAENEGTTSGTSYGLQVPGFQRSGSRGRSETGRALYLPDEVRRMPLEEQLLFVKGHDPVRARKLRYFEDAEFAGLYDLNPLHRIDVLNGSS
jgi:type IV secretion system protein VirD4